MGSLGMTCQGLDSSSDVSNDGQDESICVPKAAEGSCSNLQGRESDSEIDQVLHSRGVSSVVAADCVVDIETGDDEVRISLGRRERECRICLLSLDSESGMAIELGCSCKDDMAAAHKDCAETWFRTRGNNICEICHSIAQNIVIPNNTEPSQQTSQVNTVSTYAVPVPLYEVNTVSTNAVQVSGVYTFSANAVPVPVSSSSQSQAWSILEQFIESVLIFMIIMFVLWLSNGGRN